MIGDGPVFETEADHVTRDFFRPTMAVAPGRVVVERAVQVRPFDQAWQGAFFSRGEFALVLTQFRRDVVQIEFCKHLLLGPARHEQLGIARFFFRLEQAVFIETQAALDRALAHDDVVLLVPGEIHQREWILGVAHHAQVGLNAAFQDYARLRFTLGADAQDTGLASEKINHGVGLLRRNEEVDIADGFAKTPHAAARAAMDGFGMATQIFENRLRHEECVAEQMSRGKRAVKLDALENFRLGLFAETSERGYLARFASGFELFRALNAELVIQRLDLLRPNTWDLKQLDEAAWHGRFEFVIIAEFAGGNQFVDLFRDAFADAFDLIEATLGDDLHQRLIQTFERARGVVVSASFERILAFEFQERANLDEDFRNF